jgi:phosphoribosylanthranilate isomerase
MALKTNVLVENITNLSEARYCAGMGVQFLAFPMQHVDPKLCKDITGWVHGPEIAIDIQNNSNLSVDLNEYQAPYIICSVSQLTDGLQSASKFIVRLTPTEWNANKLFLKQHHHEIDYLLFSEMNKESIDEASKEFKVFVAMKSNSLSDLLALPIEGIALRGSDEMKAGLKSYEHLSEVLEELEVEG